MTTGAPGPGLFRASARVVSGCLVLQLGMAMVAAAAYWHGDLRFAWSTAVPHAVMVCTLSGVAFYLWRQRDALAPMVAAVALLASASVILSPAQYLAVASRRPLVDAWLAQGDAWLGVHVPAVTAWTAQRGWLVTGLRVAYATLIVQVVTTPILVMWHRREERVWEFVALFHVCAAVTVLSLAVFPAACVFQYYDFQSLLDQSRFIAHFNGVRAGTMPIVRFDELEGLISMPSFHVAVGLLTTWAVRGLPAAPVYWVLNAAMVVSTVLLGAHYVVDLIATLALVAMAVWGYRRALPLMHR